MLWGKSLLKRERVLSLPQAMLFMTESLQAGVLDVRVWYQPTCCCWWRPLQRCAGP